MSKRTAEASKAVKIAWEQEKERVLQGKGTRDWTEEQQRDILDPAKGKAYDENGHAFQGQHMKSVEAYPNFQGNPDNIQFLTEEEHFYGAHKGSWNNPTNCYYDPVSKEFIEFETDELIPCAIIELSNPIITMGSVIIGNVDDESDQPNVVLVTQTKEDLIENDREAPGCDKNILERGRKPNKPVKPGLLGRVWNGIKKNWKEIGAGIGIILGGALLNSSNSSSSSTLLKGDRDLTGKKASSQKKIDEACEESSILDATEREESIEHGYPEERSSPKKHNVSGYERKQNGKTVQVKSYTRGKDKE